MRTDKTAFVLGPRSLAAIYALLTVLVLIPVFSIRIPCLGDYLNHLARIHILTTIGRSPDLQRFFVPIWQLVPYYGMDVPVAGLSHFMSLYNAGRIFVAICVLMPVAAAAALHYALYRRIGIEPALAYLLSYNYVLALGFLNYLFTAGLAVMLFAAWIATAAWPRAGRIALFAPLATLLYLSHALGFVAYAILVFGHELARAWRQTARRLPAIAADFITAGAPAVPAVLLAFSLRTTETFGAVKVTRYGSLSDRIGALLSPVYFPGDAPLIVGAFIALPLLACLAARPLRVSQAVWPAVLAVAVAAVAAPHMLLNIWGTDLRLPLVAAIVFIGAAAPLPRLGRPAAGIALGMLAALLAVRVWDSTALLRRLDTQIASLRQVVAALPRGARLLVVDGPPDAPGRLAPLAIIEHMAEVATIDRDAFVPMLFTTTTPLQLLPAMRNSASQAVSGLTLAQLREGYENPEPAFGVLPPWRDGAQKYWLGWPAKFNYVLLTRFGADPGPLPPILHLLAGNDVATLFRVAPAGK